MSSYVLFSAVGSTDPVRNNYDGPMLHIIRHYNPKKVVLVLSEEMEKREKKDNIYTKAIYSLKPEIEVELIESQIERVFEFDEFKTFIPKEMDRVAKENSESTILVNISSGTLQMVNAMNLHIVSSQNNFKPIQVLTPEAGPNKSRVVTDPYDVDVEIGNNLDNDDSFGTPNRTREIDLDIYRRAILFEQIKELIKNYNYEACISLVNSNKAKFSDKLKNLLNHAKYRMLLNHEKANNHVINEYSDLKVDCSSYYMTIIEFYNLLKIKAHNKNYSELLIMLEPFTQELMRYFLKFEYKFDVKKYKEKFPHKDQETIRISADRIKKFDEKLYQNTYDSFNKGYVSSELYFYWDAINYFFNKNAKKDSELEEFRNMFETFIKIKKQRNKVAHELYRVNENSLEVNLNNIINKSEKFILKYFSKHIKKNQLGVYDLINERIIKELVEHE